MEQTLRKVFIGESADLPEKLGKTVVIGQKEIAIFKLENGSIKAIENRCPHKGGVLAEGILSGEYVFCPMHDRKISVENGRVQEPDDGCVKTYPVEVLEGHVFILIAE
ncbi:nitrite reductase [Mesobacillus campisalis]|uniref:Nitrite reductase n=1 Tax=Mesobacillus campisalis TaxID=1408103 RepID=A0A0M2STG6_9BACI|nr:nitrite reductase small subunit NirD [Mesobacillus campisalis]KKK37418.1 nitrite reductase [Mesobacillus campisalis]